MNITKKHLELLPEGFDWELYLKYNPDLVKNGLVTQVHAIAHYLTHGRNENRVYKSALNNHITTNISATSHYLGNEEKYINKIVLFIQWYNPDDPEVLKNITECLDKNLHNKFIYKICLLLEHDSVKKSIPSIFTNNFKIDLYTIGHRVSYKDWITIAEERYKPYIKILSNTDIYFDYTLQALLTQNFNSNTVYSITRKDLDTNGNIVQSHDTYKDGINPTNPIYSQDCWIYRDTLNHSLNVNNLNYQLGIGNCDRIFKKIISEDAGIHFINLYPHINAIHVDRRTTRNRKSYKLTDYNLVNVDKYNIKKYICYQDLKTTKRNLEAIAVLVTGKEFENGSFDKFAERFNDSIEKHVKNLKCAQNIDFNIISQKNISESNIKKINHEFFKEIKHIQIDIPDKYDTYQNDITDPIYGKTTGPNYVFFKVMRDGLLSEYDTTLFLETDVFFNEKWLYDTEQHCKNNYFWVSGSKNMGYNEHKIFHINTNHINGGVCLYATGNKNFQAFIDFCYYLLPEYVHHILESIPYDYVLYKVIEDFFNYDIANRYLWKYIGHLYQSNNIIHNLSSPSDENTDIDEYRNKFPFGILHKKDSVK